MPTTHFLINNAPLGAGPSFVLNNATNGTEVKVRLTSDGSCTNPAVASQSVIVNCIITAIPQIDGLESYVITPNLPNGFVVVNKTNSNKKVSANIMDLNGKDVQHVEPFNANGATSKQIDVSHLPAGIYFIRVTIGKQSFTNKLIKM